MVFMLLLSLWVIRLHIDKTHKNDNSFFIHVISNFVIEILQNVSDIVNIRSQQKGNTLY